MTAAIHRVFVVRNGHIVHEFNVELHTAPAAAAATIPLTWHELAKDAPVVRQRWQDIVDMMLAGQRETGSGRVMPA